jgi:hypothetical protein
MADDHSAAPRLITTRADAEVAAEIKREAEALVQQLCEVYTKARTHGLWLKTGVSTDQFSRFVPMIEVSKIF